MPVLDGEAREGVYTYGGYGNYFFIEDSDWKLIGRNDRERSSSTVPPTPRRATTLPIRTLRSWSGCGTLWWARSAARRRSTPSRSSWPPRRHHRPEPQYEGARIRCSSASSGPCMLTLARGVHARDLERAAGRSPGQRGGDRRWPHSPAWRCHVPLALITWGFERGPAFAAVSTVLHVAYLAMLARAYRGGEGERRLSGLARGGAGPGARGRGGRPRPGHLSRAGGGCASRSPPGSSPSRADRLATGSATLFLPGLADHRRDRRLRSPRRGGVEEAARRPTWL